MKFNLDDLYIRFFRIAERRIVKGGKGIISYISNFSYLGDSSFVIMREHFLKEFDKLWFDCMNGDSRETGKKTPEDEPDPSVFSTEQNKQGIRVGTTINLMVRKTERHKNPQVRFRHFWGVNKRKELLDSIKAKNINGQYRISKPEKSNRYSFRPSNVAEHYLEWPLVNLLAEIPPITGYKENRGFVLIDDSYDILVERMEKYFNPQYSWENLCLLNHGLTRDAARFNAREARGKVTSVEKYNPDRIKRYLLRPYETKWCYYCPVRPLWNEPRPSLYQHHFVGNSFLICRPSGVASPEGVPIYFTKAMGDFDCIRGHSYHFPIRLYHEPSKRKKGDYSNSMFSHHTANLSESSRRYLKQLGIKNPDQNEEEAVLIWMHSLAICYSPAYLSENEDGIRQDYPRIPLPDSRDVLLSSAVLGKDIAALLDTESTVKTVTSGTIRPELRSIGVISHVTNKSINPQQGKLDMTAGWGHFGKNNVVMPGKGKIVERSYDPKELDLLKEGTEKLDLTLNQALDQLGKTTFDIYLNDVAYWGNIPANVWNYYIGGYQVIKKWLSYREKEILGRGLKIEEAHEVMNMARRIAAIILLQPALDQNYQEVKKSTFNWSRDK